MLSKKKQERFDKLLICFPSVNWGKFPVSSFEDYFMANRKSLRTKSYRDEYDYNKKRNTEELWLLYKVSGMAIEEFYEVVKKYDEENNSNSYRNIPSFIEKGENLKINPIPKDRSGRFHNMIKYFFFNLKFHLKQKAEYGVF